MRRGNNTSDLIIDIIKIAAIIILGFVIIKGLLQALS